MPHHIPTGRARANMESVPWTVARPAFIWNVLGDPNSHDFPPQLEPGDFALNELGVVYIYTGLAWTLVDSGGAPTNADYLVGTAQDDLSAEIVAGATPAGELGGTWGAPTVVGTHSGSAHHASAHASTHADGGSDELAIQDLASDSATDGQVAKADGAGAVALENDTAVIAFVIDGGGAVITTGIKGDLEIPFACTIQRVTMLADQSGSIVVDIWKDTYANYPPTDADSITASAVPTITTDTDSQDATLTGWTTAITAGDTLRYNVDSVTTIERVTVSLYVLKT